MQINNNNNAFHCLNTKPKKDSKKKKQLLKLGNNLEIKRETDKTKRKSFASQALVVQLKRQAKWLIIN